MRHFNKIDGSVSLSLFFACVLTVIAACVAPSGPLGAPNVIQTGTVSSVRLTLAQSTLAPGQTTQATAVAASADGTVVGGRVDFSSQNPLIATVSSNGVVTALTAGVSMIQAAVGSRAASATVTVHSAVSPVAVLAVSLDSTSLAIGHSAKATAIAKDSAGNLITGQIVTWASLSSNVATVSSTGTVTAVAAGSATIQGMVSGTAGSASLTVVQVSGSTILAFHDFNDGTLGPYQFLYTAGHFDIVDDPTGSGRGKVARFFFSPTASNISDDEVINPSHVSVPVFRYGYTLWFKGDVYFPSANTSGVSKNSNLRKLIDFKGAGGNRMIIYRQRDDNSGFGTFSNDPANSHSAVHMSIYRDIGGTATEIMAPYCGFGLDDDTWYTIEVMMKTNSADGVDDGIVEIYINGAATPIFRQATGLSWINEAANSNFNFLMIGSQLSAINSSDLFSEYRYWDNVSFSTTRMGQ